MKRTIITFSLVLSLLLASTALLPSQTSAQITSEASFSLRAQLGSIITSLRDIVSSLSGQGAQVVSSGGYDGLCSDHADIQNMPDGTWCKIDNTDMRSVEKKADEYPDWNGTRSDQFSSFQRVMGLRGIHAYSGGAWDRFNERLFIWGGGHNDYGGNDFYEFSVDTLSWERLVDPTPNPKRAPDWINSDNTPVSRHTYKGNAYISSTDQFFSLGGAPDYGPGACGVKGSWLLNLNEARSGSQGAAWELGSSDGEPSTGCYALSVYVENLDVVIYFNKKDNGLYEYSVADDSWRFVGNYNNYNQLKDPDIVLDGSVNYQNAVYDPHRQMVYFMGFTDGKVLALDVSSPNYTMAEAEWRSPAGTLQSHSNPGLVYYPAQHTIIAFTGGTRVWMYDPDANTWDMHLASDSNLVDPTTNFGNGVYDRIGYSEDHNVIITQRHVDDDMYVYKPTSQIRTGNSALNKAPVATDVQAFGYSGSQQEIYLSASDENKDSLTFSIVGQPSNGSASLRNNVVTYTPTNNFSGTDTFTYRVSDGVANSNVRTVTVSVRDIQHETIVDFGTSAQSDILTSDWDTVTPDTYTLHLDVGPGGIGTREAEATYTYVLLTGTGKQFLANDELVATIYNDRDTSITFTPHISFDDLNRRYYDPSGNWYPMSEVTIPAKSIGISTYTFQSDQFVGSINFNLNHANTRTTIVDKLEHLYQTESLEISSSNYDGFCSSQNDVDDMPDGTWCEVENSNITAVEKKPQEYFDWNGSNSRAYNSIQRNLRLGNGLFAWSGGTYDSKRDRMLVFGGGHNAYGGNEVYAFSVPELSWSRLTDPTPFPLRISPRTMVYSEPNPVSSSELGTQVNYTEGIVGSAVDSTSGTSMIEVNFDEGFDGWVDVNKLNPANAAPGSIKPGSFSQGDRVRIDDGSHISVGNYDNTPISRHSYSGVTYVASTDEMFVYGGAPDSATGGCGTGQPWLLSLSGIEADGYDPGDWRRTSTEGAPRTTCDGWTRYVSSQDSVYARFMTPGQHFGRYDVQADTWHHLSAFGSKRYSDAVYDPSRNKLYDLGDIYRHPRSTAVTYSETVFDMSTAVPAQQGYVPIGDYERVAQQPGLVYHPGSGKIIQWRGGTDIVVYDPDNRLHTLIPASSANAADPGSDLANGAMYGRMIYSPEHDVIALVNSARENVFLYKVGNVVPSGSEPVNSAPTGANSTYASNGSNVDIELVGLDADNDDLTFTILEQPSNGSLSGREPSLVYNPDNGFSGTDSFTYKINDGKTDSPIYSVTVVTNLPQPQEEPQPQPNPDPIESLNAVQPTWNQSPIGAQFHTLGTDQAVSIDLNDYVRNADRFEIITSTQDLDKPLLPAGLTLNKETGIISGTPTETGVFGIRMRAFNDGYYDAEASWEVRTDGISYNSERFANNASVRSVSDRLSGTKDYSQWDSAVKRSGNGSLYQILPEGVGRFSTANWNMPLKKWSGTPPSEAGFNPGDEFYIQFAYKPNRAQVSYKGWQPNQNPKISIIDMLDPFPGGPTANSWEVVTTLNNGHLLGYYNGPNGAGSRDWSKSMPSVGCNGSPDFRRQPLVDNGPNPLNGVDPGFNGGRGEDSNWSRCMQARGQYGSLYGYSGSLLNNLPDPVSGGEVFAYDQWHTILQYVKVGTPGKGNAHLTTWMAQEGQDYVKLYDQEYDLRALPSSQETVFEAIWLLNLAYGSNVPDKPLTETWYDEVIVSDSFIPAPGVGDGTGTLRSSDTIITFRVNDTGSPIVIPDPLPNTRPIATPTLITTLENQPKAVTLIGTDAENDTLSYTITTDPKDGTLSGIAPNLTYTPDSNFTGKDHLTFTVNDGDITSTPARVSITVEATQSVVEDTDQDGVPNTIDKCPRTPANLVSFVNQRGCPKPKLTKLDIRPDFEADELETKRTRDLELGDTRYGKISWLQKQIKLTKKKGDYEDRLDLDAIVTITPDSITVDSSALPDLNTEATITFFNVTKNNPYLTRDGVRCTECTKVSQENGTVVFTVPGFSTYTLEEESTSGGGSSSGGGGSASLTRTPTVPTFTPTYTTTPIVSNFGYTFTASDFAYLDVEHEGVRQLQRALNQLGFTIATDGPGSPGNESNYFGPATESALKQFQRSYGIADSGTPATTGYGSFGPQTRSKLNEVLSRTSTNTTPTTLDAERQRLLEQLLTLIAILTERLNEMRGGN